MARTETNGGLSPLHRMALHHGLTLSYDAPDGTPRPVPEATLRLILTGMGVSLDDTPTGPGAPTTMALPQNAQCHLPDDLRDAPAWGIFCQLYELRSDRNMGIGDFADLARLAEICGAAGADFLGVNPLHALFTAAPDRRSPFSPSNRRFLNPLYIAVDQVTDAPLPAEAEGLRAAEVVDYPAVAAVKLRALRLAFDSTPFPKDGGHADFDRFVAEGGPALRLHALFEALSHHLTAQGHGAGWHVWPEELRDPTGAAVAELGEVLAEETLFHLWLQWIARRQLTAASDAARAAGMRIGLYLDLAVGEAPDGSSTWSGAAAALPGLSIGAPPDVFATTGQNWGLSAPSPAALAEADFAPYREMIAAQLRDAGALRIDHVMALWQVFLIPEHESPAAGTHLRQPFADLVETLAALSREHRAVVIGEDLGFVPDGFQEAMAQANILSYRILYFEQDETGFHDASEWPASALACLSTHDLPVMAAWWQGVDVDLREAHGLVDADNSALHRQHRAQERAWMVEALRPYGAAAGDAETTSADNLPDSVLEAAHRYLARTPSLLAGVRLADLAGPVTLTNLPGTTDAHPNWQPRSATRIEALAELPAFRTITALMRQERPRG